MVPELSDAVRSRKGRGMEKDPGGAGKAKQRLHACGRPRDARANGRGAEAATRVDLSVVVFAYKRGLAPVLVLTEVRPP